MGTGELHVKLAMESSLLTSAIQQCLAGNPRLLVTVHSPDEPVCADTARTVRIALLEDPVRFALDADGREWVLEYQSLGELARLLADLENADVMVVDRG